MIAMKNIRAGPIRIRIPDPRIHGSPDNFRGVVFCCAFGRRNARTGGGAGRGRRKGELGDAGRIRKAVFPIYFPVLSYG